MTKELFKNGDPQTNGLANRQDQYIDIYHLPTKNSVKFKAYVTAYITLIPEDNTIDFHYRGIEYHLFEGTTNELPNDLKMMPQIMAT